MREKRERVLGKRSKKRQGESKGKELPTIVDAQASNFAVSSSPQKALQEKVLDNFASKLFGEPASWKELLDTVEGNSNFNPCWDDVRFAVSLALAELLPYKVFYDHIKRHFEKEHPDWKVMCKICGKSFEQIVKEVGET